MRRIELLDLSHLIFSTTQGVCHRDLKPENILFTGVEVCDDACKGESDGSAAGFHEPVITDFGLAVSFDMTHATQATTRSMPPRLSSV